LTKRFDYTCLQMLHRLEILITRGAEGKTGKAFIADMTEEKSIEYASKLASEGFVLTVSDWSHPHPMTTWTLPVLPLLSLLALSV
jgi:hypothetical protein